MERREVLKMWRKYLNGEIGLKIYEFDDLREKVIKIIEEEYKKIKKELKRMGVKYRGYIEVDGGDVYLFIKIKGGINIFFDGFNWEIVNKNDRRLFKDLNNLLEYFKNLN